VLNDVTRPPFTYFGGKTNLAARIVPLLPPHTHYVEPFAGSLALLLAKPRSPLETVNDLDGDLMLFWRVLRDRPDDLERVCALTPHSRAEYQAAYALDVTDELERARRVWVLLSQGRGGTLRRTGWRFFADPAGTGLPGYLAAYTGRMAGCAARLAGVSLECRPALDIITRYGAHPEVLLYCDPPYIGSTRSANYRLEMLGDAVHEELAEALRACAASVVLSGYPSGLYDRLYDGWHRAELAAWTGQGNGANRRDGHRVEVLWSNRPLERDMDLFSDATG
jgi:DNA adenine methylase